MTRGAGRTCPSCGSLNKPNWEFCARCGEQLDTATLAVASPRAAASGAPPTVYDDDFGFPWRQAFLLLLAAAVIAGAIGIRKAGPPAAGAFLTIPTVPPAPEASAAPKSIDPVHASLFEGKRLLAGGDALSALEPLARAAAEMPGDPAAQSAYARALWTVGRKDEALSRYRQAAQLGREATYQVDLARTLVDMGQAGDAQQVLEQAAVNTPDDPRVLQDLGQLYTNTGASDRAVPLLRRAMELRSDDPKIMAQLGVALEKSGERGEAITVFQGTLDKLPNSQMARTLLADALYKDGRKDDAMQVVQAGLTTMPQSSMLHRTLGLLLERSGRAGDAAQAYRDYLRLAPDAPDAQELAARAARLEKRAGTTASSS